MTRETSPDRQELDLADAGSVLSAIAGGRVPSRMLIEVLQRHREASPDGGSSLTFGLAGEVIEGRKAIQKLTAICQQMEALQAKLLESPWYPARVVDLSCLRTTGHVLVSHAGAQRMVRTGDDVDVDTLRIGDLVYLSRGGELLMRRAAAELTIGGETAMFERVLSDDRLMVRVRDEQILLRRGANLSSDELRDGSLLRIDRAASLALESLGNGNRGRGLFTDDMDTGGIAAGGRRVRDAIARITDALHLALLDPGKAARYGLGKRRAILLSGPPGVGKTLCVRCVMAELAHRTGRRCRLAIVRPGEFESPWVGETERNIRETFARLKAEAGDDLAVIYLDEIESIGRTRGGSNARLADKFLAPLLVELDGITARGNIAVIASTNRKDLLDPALLERLSEIDIEVPRPDLDSAREIFAAHLAGDLPWAAEAGSPASVRDRVIDTAVSMLYAPNASSRIAQIQFRDGTVRHVEAREMASGRLIEQVCRRIRELACGRGEPGSGGDIGLRDAQEAISEALERLRSSLTVHNVRSWVDGLPSDIDIVRVTAESPAVKRPYRYLRAA